MLHTPTHAPTNTPTYTHTHSHTHIYIYTHMHTHTHVYIYTHTHLFPSFHTKLSQKVQCYTGVYQHLIYIYTHTHTHTHTLISFFPHQIVTKGSMLRWGLPTSNDTTTMDDFTLKIILFSIQLQSWRPDGCMNIYCRDARFCRQQEQTCGQRQSSYKPNSTAARRNWRRRLHSSCRLDSECSGDREEEEEEGCFALSHRSHTNIVCKRRWQVTAKHAYTLRMRLCMKWHGAWLCGVHRTHQDSSSFMWHQPCQHCKYTTSVDIQKRAIKS